MDLESLPCWKVRVKRPEVIQFDQSYPRLPTAVWKALPDLRSVSIKLRVLSSLLLFFPAGQLAAQAAPNAHKVSPSRTFRFTYSFTVKGIPSGAKRVRVWIPMPMTDLPCQTMRVLAVKSPVKTRMRHGGSFDNPIMYAEIQNSGPGNVEFTIEYEVTRRECSRGNYAQLERKEEKSGVLASTMQKWVDPDTLIPTDGKIKTLAVEVTGAQTGTIAKAKAAYDYLFTNIRYDTTGSGWGRGDAVWASDAKRGDCTDFHSLFIGMMRAEGIPAGFDIGFPIPENKHKGNIAGYHCWAKFYAPNVGWIPVDILAAWQAKEKQDYFFGTVDANRVWFSTGRDIVLSPRQHGPPLNYFVYPYVEIDGKPYDKLDKQFSFEEVMSSE
jgi:transglutaminase-like putative cysteine protease